MCRWQVTGEEQNDKFEWKTERKYEMLWKNKNILHSIKQEFNFIWCLLVFLTCVWWFILDVADCFNFHSVIYWITFGSSSLEVRGECLPWFWDHNHHSNPYMHRPCGPENHWEDARTQTYSKESQKAGFYQLKSQIQTVLVPTGDHCSPDGFLKEFNLVFILIMVSREYTVRAGWYS